MKKTKLFAAAGMIAVCVFTLPGIQSQPKGAPAVATGGPAEGGATCAQNGCHAGTATSGATFMSTDIPAEGYTPETQYNITINMPSSGKKGFMFSAQDSIGTLLGTVTAGSGSKVVFNNYVTHDAVKTSNPGVWTFKWTAPAAGTGKLNLHGAFAINTTNTRTQVIAVNEKLASGLNELAQQIGLKTYHNTAEQLLNLAFNLNNSQAVKVQLLNLNGQVCNTIFDGNMQGGAQTLSATTNAQNAGVYLLQIQLDDQAAYQKVMISK